MKKAKFQKLTMDELAKELPVVPKEEQQAYVGGGDGTSGNPYTWDQFDYFADNNNMLRMIFSLLIAFLACFFVNCDEQSSKKMSKEERKMEAMLKEFYTAYITAVDKGPFVLTSDTILKEYSTAELLKEIEDVNKDDYVLSFDPFISAQDASVKWLETLSITKDTLLKHTFVITMEDVFISGKVREERLIKIKVTVVKDGDRYKIGDILEPDWRKYKNQS